MGHFIALAAFTTMIGMIVKFVFDEIKGKKIRIDGYLEEFSLSRKEADELVMAAREIAYK